MNRLQAELHRLYLSHGGIVLELARPASWDLLAPVWRGVQADLDLPAPAIAVSGVDSYQLWFSFAEPVPAPRRLAFLESLRRRYLAGVGPERIGMTLSDDAVLPPTEPAPGHWSAFVAPDLAALFADEPWLDLPPGADAQADLLSRVQSIRPADWKRALERFGPMAQPAASGVVQPAAAQATGGADPKAFLLQVMNDDTVDLQLRIDAARALLPYVGGQRP
jgi:hypothetical protein